MPKVAYNPEKVRKQKRIIGAVAITLLVIVAIFAIVIPLHFLVWILINVVIAGVANLLLRRVGRVTA